MTDKDLLEFRRLLKIAMDEGIITAEVIKTIESKESAPEWFMSTATMLKLMDKKAPK